MTIGQCAEFVGFTVITYYCNKYKIALKDAFGSNIPPPELLWNILTHEIQFEDEYGLIDILAAR